MESQCINPWTSHREHEAAIRNYQGTDPLDPWFNYIQWVEQSYPKHGHEGHMKKLIKDCLQLYENDQKYYQDRRFVKLWIKYVSIAIYHNCVIEYCIPIVTRFGAKLACWTFVNNFSM